MFPTRLPVLPFPSQLVKTMSQLQVEEAVTRKGRCPVRVPVSQNHSSEMELGVSGRRGVWVEPPPRVCPSHALSSVCTPLGPCLGSQHSGMVGCFQLLPVGTELNLTTTSFLKHSALSSRSPPTLLFALGFLPEFVVGCLTCPQLCGISLVSLGFLFLGSP